MIREAKLEDVREIHRLIEILEHKKFEFDAFEKVLKDNLNNDNYYYFVAEISNKVAGFISFFEYTPLHTCAKVLEIQELIVDEKLRGQKIGEQLLKHVEQIIANNDWHKIELTSSKLRVKAHAFYIRNNYKPSHIRFKKII